MTRSSRLRRTLGVTAAGALLGSALVAAPSGAAPSQTGCDNRSNNTYDKLLECVRLDGVMEHLDAFQDIADANDGNRADQTPGYAASVDYVVETLEDAGWSAEVAPFTYLAGDVELSQVSPVSAGYPAYDAAGGGEGGGEYGDSEQGTAHVMSPGTGSTRTACDSRGGCGKSDGGLHRVVLLPTVGLRVRHTLAGW